MRSLLRLGRLFLPLALVPFACVDDSPSRAPEGSDAGAFDAGGGLDAATADVTTAPETGPGPDATGDASPDAADASSDVADASDAADSSDAADAADADAGPQLPPDALKGIQVLAGERWSLVVAPSRALYAFGQYINPANGQYQNGGTYASTPVVVQGIDSVKEVVGYGSAFFALKTDGTVYGWGHINSYAAFGQGKDSTAGGVVTQNAPVQVLTAAATPITNVCQLVATAYGAVMVRSAEGGGACTPGGARTVWYTGDSLTGYEPGLPVGLFAKSFTRLDPASGSNVTGGTSVDRIYANSYYVSSISLYARLTDGRVFAWGNNQNGQLGLGDQLYRDGPTAVAAWNNAVSIASAAEVTLALMPGGGLIGAGSALGSTLGNGTTTNTFQTTPGAVSTLTQVTRVSVATSHSAAFAIQGGELFFWGTSPRFGTTATTPRVVTSASGPFVEVSVGNQHALALNATGGVYSFGGNQLSGLGCGACADRADPTLVTVP